MSTQPEALRLADELAIQHQYDFYKVCEEAAAELRRLHGLDFALRNCEQALKNMATKYMDTVDQRDALLEALELLVSYTESCEGLLNASPAGQVLKARAVIKAAEGEKT